ncbi:MAG TPA: hypothetical protein PKD49_04570 [Hyphomicrobium sp.]|nr:hypothetical protein [Hyphomicrobium sp.]
MFTQIATNDVGVRQLDEHEIDAVNGGLVNLAFQILGYLAAREYIQWCKDNDKL